MTYFCYIDESGTPDLPGNSSHFVLVGFAIPIQKWHEADGQIREILSRYSLAEAEIHTAWLLRRLGEQEKIKDFERMNYADRKSAVVRYRASELLRLQRNKDPKAYRQAKKNYQHTEEYIHLTLDQRKALLVEIANCVAGWDYAVLFAEAIDKIHFDPNKTGRSISSQSFEQIVSRFEQYLFKDCQKDTFGVLVHDNNETVAKKHTAMMRDFHIDGTLWSKINRIAETPLFVDSKLTRMVQIADLCSYAVRV